MLKKLLKYDLKAVLKYWWIVALSSIVLSCAGGWSISVFVNEKELPITLYIVATIVAIIVILGISMFYFATAIFIYTRFYKNFFTDEGYLTFTLPVKRTQLLNSKLITSIIASSMTGFIVVIDFFIAIFIGISDLVDKNDLSIIWDEFSQISTGNMIYLVVFVIEILLLLVLCEILATLFVFCCITIASIIAKKAKIITAIGIYYVANSISSSILSIFWLFGASSIGIWMDAIPVNYACPVFALLLLMGIFFLGILCTAFYSLQYWMLDRKLNLS